MISYLPEIYPDELVYSWFCRYYVHSGCLTHKMALDDILYKRCNNPSKEFLGHLNPDMQKKIQEILPIETLILQHTMFPQYARFIPLEDKKKATPTPTTNISNVPLIISLTCEARTVRSGSAIVINSPKAKQTDNKIIM